MHFLLNIKIRLKQKLDSFLFKGEKKRKKYKAF